MAKAPCPCINLITTFLADGDDRDSCEWCLRLGLRVGRARTAFFLVVHVSDGVCASWLSVCLSPMPLAPSAVSNLQYYDP